jgi:hypothetical protein
MRLPIRFDRAFEALSRVLLLPPSDCYVDVDGDDVSVRFGWAFSAKFPRSAVKSVAPFERFVLSRGVHGWAGRWLVNGSGDAIRAIDLEPVQWGRVLGVPVRLRQLLVSIEDPATLERALRGERPR